MPGIVGSGQVGQAGDRQLGRTVLGSEPHRSPPPATGAWGSGSNLLFAGQEAGNNGRDWCWHPGWPGEQESSSTSSGGRGRGVASLLACSQLLEGLEPPFCIFPSVQRQLHREPSPDLPAPNFIPSPEQALDEDHKLLKPWRVARGLIARPRLACDKLHIPSSSQCFLCSLKVMPLGKALAAIDFHRSTKILAGMSSPPHRALKRRSRGGVGVGQGLWDLPLHSACVSIPILGLRSCLCSSVSNTEHLLFARPRAGATGHEGRTWDERVLRFSCISKDRVKNIKAAGIQYKILPARVLLDRPTTLPQPGPFLHPRSSPLPGPG